ncbi:MAG: glycosyltransferase family 9 protein [bacterium]|nr:glycosyltransferase family 9 protein [bacterium]
MKVRGGEGEPRDILIVMLGGLAELIQLTPSITLLTRAYPGAGIDILCEKPYKTVLRHNPHVRSLIGLDSGTGGRLRGVLERLKGNYDLLIDCTNQFQFALISRLSGIPTRVGRVPYLSSLFFNKPAAVELWSDAPLEPVSLRLCRFMGDVCPAVRPGQPRFVIDRQEVAEGRRILEDRSIAPNRVAILCGTDLSSPEWPASYFVRLAAQVLMEGNMATVFIGQPGQRERLEEIRQLSNSQVSILPECDIRTLAGILANCDALVTPCNALMHLAIACGVPTLAIFGAENPAVEFPYLHLAHAALVGEDLECSPCGHEGCKEIHCLESLSPEKVYAHLRELLANVKR